MFDTQHVLKDAGEITSTGYGKWTPPRKFSISAPVWSVGM